MRRKDILHAVLIFIIILFIATNINAINSFLSLKTDKSIEFGHSATVVPEAWNTTEELNMTNESKTPNAITNKYVVIDHCLKTEDITLGGIPVSKQYFSNPSRDTDTIWNHIGVNYVFHTQDTNYAIQLHYFTDHDYNNTTFQKEVDYRIEDDMANIHNNQYNGFVSGIRDMYNFMMSFF